MVVNYLFLIWSLVVNSFGDFLNEPIKIKHLVNVIYGFQYNQRLLENTKSTCFKFSYTWELSESAN